MLSMVVRGIAIADYYGKYHGDINIGQTHIAAKLGLRLNLYKLPF